MKTPKWIHLFSVAMLMLASGGAWAHTGAGAVHGFGAGFVHPLLGLDHLLAMLAVGLWATVLGGRALWFLPVAFVGMMSMGAAGFQWGLTLPYAEWGVAISVAVLGLVLWRNWCAASVWASLLVAVFAVAHGYVHAAEIGTDMDAAAYAGGFLLATAILHVLGIAMGLMTRKLEPMRRLFGLFCGGVGIYLLSSL